MKRWFISLYLVALVGLVGWGVAELFRPSPWFSGLGLVLAAGGPLGFFAWLILAGPARTAAHPVGVSVIAGLGMVLAMAAVYRFGEAWQPQVAGALAALAGWMIYLRWYSRQPHPDNPPKTGQPLPEFRLEDADGQPVDSGELAGSPAVLVFYRGNWCPLCTAQIRELAAHWREIERAGAALWFISNQPAGHTRQAAKRFGIPARFLRDPENRAARALGIASPGAAPAGMELLGYPADTALPCVIVIDAQGIVRYIEVAENYRIRPDPEAYLQILRDHAIEPLQEPSPDGEGR